MDFRFLSLEMDSESMQSCPLILKLYPLQIKWDQSPLSAHLSNYYTPSKPTHKAPDSSEGMESSVFEAHQVQMIDSYSTMVPLLTSWHPPLISCSHLPK